MAKLRSAQMGAEGNMTYRIDGLHYANWSEKIFRQMRAGGVDPMHVTIARHETFREIALKPQHRNRWFRRFPDLIFRGRRAGDIRAAKETGRTAIFPGLQNPSPIEDGIGLVEILHSLGARSMQLTHDNQSLLATARYKADEATDIMGGNRLRFFVIGFGPEAAI